MDNKKLLNMSILDIENHFSELNNFFLKENYNFLNIFNLYKKYFYSNNNEEFYNFYIEPYIDRFSMNKEKIDNLLNNKIDFITFFNYISRSRPLFDKFSYDPLFTYNNILIGFQEKNNAINVLLITSIIDKKITDKLLSHNVFNGLNVYLSNVDTEVDFFIPIMGNDNFLFMSEFYSKTIKRTFSYIENNFDLYDIKMIEDHINREHKIFKS